MNRDRHVLNVAVVIILSMFGETRAHATLPPGGPPRLIPIIASCVNRLLNRSRESDVVEGFLTKWNAERHAINDDDLSVADLFPAGLSSGLRLSAFNSLGDTFEHSQLIAAALALHEAKHVTKVKDFFCGSSIPTLRLLAAQPELKRVHVDSVDLDADAIRVSRENAEALGLSSHYAFHVGHAVEVLRARPFGAETLIALNPPYVPQSDTVKDPKFRAIDGGPDGTKFLIPFLTHSYEPGALVAVTWSSLSNPRRIIRLIESRFEVLYVQSYVTEFGIYTSAPEILPHLISERAKGRASFTDGNNGKRSYTIIGAVLRRKSS